MAWLAPIVEFLKSYGTGLTLIVTWGTLLWVYLGKRSDWSRKQFLDQVNFSLNLVVDGQLVMRTLVEMPAQEVWLNDLGVGQVRNAAKRTTPDQPFIDLEKPEDMDFANRAVLNVLSEEFAEAYLAQSLGLPVKFETYRFAITMERYDDIRTLKMRVLLVKESELEALFVPEGCPVTAKNQQYASRLKTLQQMHTLHTREGQPGIPRLGRVILGVRV